MTSRLRLVREESMAIASERLVVPSLLRGKHIDAQEAYDVGLCMTLTILSRGWFREFGLAHYLELKDVDVDFVAKIKDDGRILVRDEVEDDKRVARVLREQSRNFLSGVRHVDGRVSSCT